MNQDPILDSCNNSRPGPKALTCKNNFIYAICRSGGPYWEKLCPKSWVRLEAEDRAQDRGRLNTEGVSHRARAFDVSAKQTRIVYKSI